MVYRLRNPGNVFQKAGGFTEVCTLTAKPVKASFSMSPLTNFRYWHIIKVEFCYRKGVAAFTMSEKSGNYIYADKINPACFGRVAFAD